jgi:DNA-binding CsgD family transcriptional regulator
MSSSLGEEAMTDDGKLERFSTILLAIYRAARELPADQFQDAALRLLKPILSFDSSMWGSGTLSASGMAVHSIHLFEQPPEMVSEWAHVNSEDTVAYACARRPGWVMNAHMPTLFHDRTKRAMRDYTTRFEKGSGLITRYNADNSSLISWISLYRADPDRHFGEDDRAGFEALVPHIVEALTINRLIHLDRTFAQEVSRESHLAVVDVRGMIHTADVGFDALLRREWSGWQGELLPHSLVAALTTDSDTAFRGGRIVVNARRIGDLLFLHARPLTPIDWLSPRESEVAKRFGAGQSYKEVARALGISPTTVRNHLQVIYGKLDVNDKAALANLVATKSRDSSRVRS